MKFEAIHEDLSVYIMGPSGWTEVFYLSLPRFTGSHCSYYTLLPSCRERIDAAFKTAKIIAKRFEADGRFDASATSIAKAFNRSHHE